MLYNYTKRNSTYPYLQSQGPIASLIAEIVGYGGTVSSEEQ